MAMNRIQFQPGLSMPEFLQQFGTETQCEAALHAARWPHGFHCPRCAGSAHSVIGGNTRSLFQCSHCRHQTSLIASPVFEGAKLALRIWFLAIYLQQMTHAHLQREDLERAQWQTLSVKTPTKSELVGYHSSHGVSLGQRD